MAIAAELAAAQNIQSGTPRRLVGKAIRTNQIGGSVRAAVQTSATLCDDCAHPADAAEKAMGGGCTWAPGLRNSTAST